MKLLTITTALALAAAPVLAGPADDFGRASAAGSTVSDASRALAVQKLSGDDLDDRINVVAPAQVTRSSQGHNQLAANMGVSPDAYSTAELAKMYIGEYD